MINLTRACLSEATCPDIYWDEERGCFVIVGRLLIPAPKDVRVGFGEVAVEIAPELLEDGYRKYQAYQLTLWGEENQPDDA